MLTDRVLLIEHLVRIVLKYAPREMFVSMRCLAGKPDVGRSRARNH